MAALVNRLEIIKTLLKVIEVIETNSLLKELDMKNIKSELKALKDQLGTEKQTFRTWDENDDDDKELLNTKIRLIKTKILEKLLEYKKKATKNKWSSQLLDEIEEDIVSLRLKLDINPGSAKGITKKRKTKNKKKRKTIKKKRKTNKRKSNKKKRKQKKKRNKTNKSKK